MYDEFTCNLNQTIRGQSRHSFGSLFRNWQQFCKAEKKTYIIYSVVERTSTLKTGEKTTKILNPNTAIMGSTPFVL